MFGILFTSAVSANIYVGKVFKIRVKNKRKVALYLKLIKTECSYRLAFNDEDQLINFLKYGKVIAVEVSHIIIKLIDLLICSRFKRQWCTVHSETKLYGTWDGAETDFVNLGPQVPSSIQPIFGMDRIIFACWRQIDLIELRYRYKFHLKNYFLRYFFRTKSDP